MDSNRKWPSIILTAAVLASPGRELD